jgi:hypothetical protein
MKTPVYCIGLMLALAAIYPNALEAQQVSMSARAKTFPAIRQGVVEMLPMSALPYPSTAAREAALALRDAQRAQGWMPAPEAQSAEIDGYFDSERVQARLRPSMAELAPSLRISPTPLEGTFLEGAKLVGVMPGGGYVDRGWTGIGRALEVDGVGRVVLEEYDYVLAGSYIVVPEELVNGRINGLPAQFSVWRTPSGKTWTQMRWFSANKEYRLFIGRPVKEGDALHKSIMQLTARVY